MHTGVSRLAFLSALLAALLAPGVAPAHGDLHERIVSLSAQLAAQPRDVTLLLQRADLRRQHGDFDDALADLAAAVKLNASRRAVLLAQARVFSNARRWTNALHAADEFLRLESNSAEAFTLRARCRFQLSQVAGAVEDFTAALALSAAPEPDVYLERAHAQAALGRFADAVRGLDEGMGRIGTVDALQLAALGFERQHGDFTAALERLDKHSARQPVKEPWLVLRGEILLQAGRLPEAKTAFQRANEGIAAYPPARRCLEQTIQLQARVREGLARVEARLTPKSKA